MNKTVILAITVLTTGILSSCSRTGGEQESAEVLGPNAIELNAEQFRTAGIVVGQAGERAIRTVLKVNGTVNVSPQNIASVSAPLGGFIKNTSLVQGSTVTQGEVLALVENMEFIELQQSYLETKARYAYAEVEFKRHSELYKENVYSEKNVQQTETEYKTLKSQLKGLEQKLLILGIDPGSLTEDNISGVAAVKSPIS